MKFIKEYNQFILEEVSKNEPIPEIVGVDRGLAIFVIGQPAIGKSFFIKNYIHTKNSNIKDFSTDDVSFLYTKDPNIYYRGKETPDGRTSNASQMNFKKMYKFIETGQNFIYDTTGAGKEFTDKGFEHVKDIFERSKSNGYKIIFIHLLSTLQTSIEQDKLRDRHVDPHYIKWAYAKQQGGEIDGQKVEGNMKRYKDLGPDSYYMITSIDKKYKFYKLIDGKLAVRKNDRYIIKESIDNETCNNQIIDTMLDFIDDGYKITFKSPIGNMTYQQHLDKEGDFHPVFKPNDTLIRYKFSIVFSNCEKFKSYDDFVKIVDEMQVTIARLSDLDWNLSDFEVSVDSGGNLKNFEPKFHSIEYKFSKPDEKVEGEIKFNIEEFKPNFEQNVGVYIRDVKENFDNIFVEFETLDYNGELPRNIEDRLERILQLYGFETYEYQWPNKYVNFFWD
jgi:hypothetical protein